MKKKRTFRPQSEEVKHFEELLSNRIHEEYADKNPDEWLYIFDGGPFYDVIYGMALSWDEVRTLVEALEDSHLDDGYTADKRYPIEHFMDTATRNIRLRDKSGDPDEIVRSQKTRAEIIARLSHIANLDFGDDPDEWRRWYKAYDDDDFFPPVR